MAEELLQSFQETFGAGIVGSFLAMGMYGLTTSQTYFYFVEYPKDKTWRKALVCTLWVLNTLHSALMFHMMYHYFIFNAFKVFELTQNVWCACGQIEILVFNRKLQSKASMIAHVHLFFTYGSIWRTKYSPDPRGFSRDDIFFSKPKLRWWLAVPNIGLNRFYTLRQLRYSCTLPLGLNLRNQAHSQIPDAESDGFNGIHGMKSINSQVLKFTKYPQKVSFLPMAATQAGADVLLAASLCFVLYDHRTAFRRLMCYAVNRCLLTAMIYIGPEFLFAGLYTNSLLATLNSRHRIRDTWNGNNDTSDLSSVHLSNVRSDALAASESHAHAQFTPHKLLVQSPVYGLWMT
ncbi:hypothetical protein B0H19DRAFT_1302510 [Mycena capillaripes]|nr:hypothetical protein B0H19DRAFT_1302510 [Mycena capillaripes]